MPCHTLFSDNLGLQQDGEHIPSYHRKHLLLQRQLFLLLYQLKITLDEARSSEINPAGEIYDETASDELLESDEITAAEFYFMMGREGSSWQRKKKHYDTTSTETSSEEYYDD